MSSRHISAKSISAVAPPPCRIHPTAVVADKAQLTGTFSIEIGAGAVVHPYARLRSEHGSLVIGAGTTIAEKAIIGLVEASPKGEYTVSIAENVTIESGAIVEASYVGAHTTIEVRAIVERGAKIGKWCKIAAKERIEEGMEIEDFTVVFADGKRRLDRTVQEHKEIRVAKQTLHESTLDALRGVVSNAAGKWAGTT